MTEKIHSLEEHTGRASDRRLESSEGLSRGCGIRVRPEELWEGEL